MASRNLLIGIIVIMAIAIGFLVGSGQFAVVDEPSVPYDPENPPTQLPANGYNLVLTLSPNDICVGESSTGTITSNMYNAICAIWVHDGTSWSHLSNVALDNYGRYSETQTIGVAGTVVFLAACTDLDSIIKVSNQAYLIVTDCDSDGDGFTDQEEIDAGTDPNDPNDFPYEGPQQIFCSSLVIPDDVGDKGGWCRKEGQCFFEDSCEHYWDWGNKEHKCGCSESFFCGQYCFEYTEYTCECPPNSYEERVSLYGVQCVPNGYECVDGTPELI